MQFTYEEGPYEGRHILKIRTDHRATIAINFKGSDINYVELNEIELTPVDDTIYAIFVFIDGQVISLAELMLKAGDAIDGIVKEVEQEASDYEAHVSAMSSPYLTGRI